MSTLASVVCYLVCEVIVGLLLHAHAHDKRFRHVISFVYLSEDAKANNYPQHGASLRSERLISILSHHYCESRDSHVIVTIIYSEPDVRIVEQYV